MRNVLLAVAALIVALAGAPLEARAQAYPSKTVRIIVPFPPGGGVDALGRIVQPGLQERLGQPVVVENKAGAAGVIGIEYTVNQPKDGYTIVIGAPGAVSVAPGLNRSLSYNPAKDLAPIVMGVMMPNLLVVNPGLKAQNVAELIALAKAEPGKLSFGSGGIGTGQHLSGELFNILAGVKLLHVPYKGTSPAINDLVAGQIQLSFTDPSALAQVQAGKLRLIGQTSAKRSALLPDTPTLAEAGLAGFDAVNWYAFFAPAGTPADVVARLHKDLSAVLTSPDVKERLVKAGMAPAPSTSENLGRFVAEDTARWGDVIRKAGIKID